MPNVDGLPAIDGLADFVAANSDGQQDKGNGQVAANVDSPDKPDQKAEPDKDLDLAQFKNPKDLLKSYKEIQSFTTRVSQENKALKDQLSQLQEAIEMQRLQQAQPMAPQAAGKKFDEQFIENPEMAVELAVERKLQTARVADVLEAEEAKNPAEFQERYSYAMRLRQYYPQLSRTPAGVSKLFELADRYRTEDMRRNADKFAKHLFGEDVDLEKFRALVAKDKQQATNNNRNAYMPDTSTGTRPEPGKNLNAHEAQISAAAEKGDIDGVLQGIFKRQLATS